MKIINRIVTDIASGQVLEVDSFDYEGPIAEAKGGSQSTTNTELPEWLQPYAQQFISAYQGQVFDENGNVKAQPSDLNQTVAGFDQNQTTAMNNIAGLTGGMQGVANQGLNTAANTLGGAYLDPNSNPYLQATFDKAARGVTDQYQNAIAPGIMASAQKSGNFGGSAMDEVMAQSRYGLGENLNNLATSIYGGNYQQERQNQLQTLQQLPNTLNAGYIPQDKLLGVGSLQQQQAQTELDTNYMNATGRAQYPFELLSGFGGALGQSSSGAGQSKVNTSGGGGMFGSVICSVLHDKGIMDNETWEKDTQYGKSLPPEVLHGYHLWAIPLARAMRKSRILTALIAPIALNWAYTMRAKLEGKPENETWLGRQLLRFGVPLCGWLGKGKPDQNSLEKVEFRQKILQAQTEMQSMIDAGILESRMAECSLTHRFVPVDRTYGCAVYAREIFIPKGTLVIGKIHRHGHLNFLLQGRVSVNTEFGKQYMDAPCTFVSEPGLKRAVVAESDVIWTTVHLTLYTGEENLDRIEGEVIAEDYSALGLLSSRQHPLLSPPLMSPPAWLRSILGERVQ